MARYYVKEAGTGHWLLGARTRPGRIECSMRYHSLDALLEGDMFSRVPMPPDGFSLRELVRLPKNPTRIASDGLGQTLYVLINNGDVWRVSIAERNLKQILRGSDYEPGDLNCFGMTLAPDGRLYICTNRKDASVKPNLNHVTIFRTSSTSPEGDPADPKPWLRTTYPWGVHNFNHGVGHMAFGPDGMLYVNSGSRTDANEASDDPNFSSEGETPLTACIWRLDPRSENPQIEVFARGLRNAYGFCWDDTGRMIATENGPNRDPPEELNHIVQGRHYGFPWVFSDWAKNPYAHIGDAPKGISFTPPIVNYGPAGGGSRDEPLSTFDPHSSPAGIVFLAGAPFPPEHRGAFLVPRFGNMLPLVRDVGFDVLQVRPRQPSGEQREADVTTFLESVARPVDIHLAGGKIYLCEYERELKNMGMTMDLTGRILELSVLTESIPNR